MWPPTKGEEKNLWINSHTILSLFTLVFIYYIVNLQICDTLLPGSTAVNKTGIIVESKAICLPQRMMDVFRNFQKVSRDQFKCMCCQIF